MKRGGDPVATFYEQISENTAVPRCRLPARHLPGESLQFVYKDEKGRRCYQMVEDKHGDPVFPNHRGAVAIWQYPGSQERAIPMAAQQIQGVKVLVEVDDNYLIEFPSRRAINRDWAESLKQNPDANHTHEEHRAILGFADGVICSTEWLAGQYREFNDNVFVCPNAVDPADWPEPDPYAGVLRIGWAASGSHIDDAPLVRRALLWASKQPRVEVHLFGDVFLTLKRSGEWKFKANIADWTNDHAEFRRRVSVMDVAVCPLIDTQFSKGKSDIKAAEAAMSGALPIVSRAEAYRPWWSQPKPPCLVVETAGGFEEAIRWCVNHRDDVQELAARARDYVLLERSFPLAVLPWREAVTAVAPKPELALA